MQAFNYNGNTYYWKEHRWMNDNYLAVEARLARELDAAFPRPPRGVRELARMRREAKEDGHSPVIVGKPKPNDAGSVAVLSGIYRDLRQPARALEVTERWKDGTDAVVLVARAAALCDLELWNEAEQTAHRALQNGGGYFARSVLERIHRQR